MKKKEFTSQFLKEGAVHVESLIDREISRLEKEIDLLHKELIKEMNYQKRVDLQLRVDKRITLIRDLRAAD